jgi:hypothetical protein
LELGRWLGTPPPAARISIDLQNSTSPHCCRPAGCCADCMMLLRYSSVSRMGLPCPHCPHCPHCPRCPRCQHHPPGGRSAVPQTKKITPSSLPGIQAAWTMDGEGIPSQYSVRKAPSLPKRSPQKLPATTVWPKNCVASPWPSDLTRTTECGGCHTQTLSSHFSTAGFTGPQKPGSAVGAPHRTLGNSSNHGPTISLISKSLSFLLSKKEPEGSQRSELRNT